MSTTIQITDDANAVLEEVISDLKKQSYVRMLKGQFASEQLIRSIWNQVPKAKQNELLRKFPNLRSVIA